MAGHDAHVHDDHGHAAHDDHHDDHGPADDRWVLAPILVGLVIGAILVAVLGFGSDVASVVH